MTRREQFVRAGETELFVREWGNGPPVLFWHALGDHTSLQMIEAGPIVADEFGYRVVGVDAPGFGGSPRIADERYQAAALVELASALLDAIGVDRVAWAGSSWGGIVGVHFAAAHPERLAALVLIDGGYLDPQHDHGKTLDELREYWRAQPGFRFPSWEVAVEEARQAFGYWSPGIEEYVRSAYREENGEVVSIMGPDVYAAAMHGIDNSPPSHVHERLGQSEVPVLLLGATEPSKEEDRRQSWRDRFAEQVPQAEVRRMEGAPHLMLEERPEDTARAIGEWLRALPYP